MSPPETETPGEKGNRRGCTIRIGLMRCPQSAFLRNLQRSNPALPQGFLLQEPQAKPAEAMALPITTASPDPAKNSLPISSPISFVAKRKSLNQLNRWLHDTTFPSAEATWLHFQTLLLCEQMSRSILYGFATRSSKEIRPASQLAIRLRSPEDTTPYSGHNAAIIHLPKSVTEHPFFSPS